MRGSDNVEDILRTANDANIQAGDTKTDRLSPDGAVTLGHMSVLAKKYGIKGGDIAGIAASGGSAEDIQKFIAKKSLLDKNQAGAAAAAADIYATARGVNGAIGPGRYLDKYEGDFSAESLRQHASRPLVDRMVDAGAGVKARSELYNKEMASTAEILINSSKAPGGRAASGKLGEAIKNLGPEEAYKVLAGMSAEGEGFAKNDTTGLYELSGSTKMFGQALPGQQWAFATEEEAEKAASRLQTLATSDAGVKSLVGQKGVGDAEVAQMRAQLEANLKTSDGVQQILAAVDKMTSALQNIDRTLANP